MYNPLILPDLREMIREDDARGLAEFCVVLHAAVTAEILEGLESPLVWKVLGNAALERQVEIFEYLTLNKQVDLVDTVDRDRLSKLVEAMSPDNRVDLLSRMDPNHVESLLPLMAKAERNDIRKLLSYPDGSAGSIMTTEYASLPEEITVGEALDRLRLQAPHRETIYYVYILDEERHLRGAISLQELILARHDAKLSKIVNREVIAVHVDDDRELVAQEIARYDFIAIPVVDRQQRLVGIVTHDDVLDVVQQEATEDAYRVGAVGPIQDGYLEMRLRTIAWKRMIWLMVLSVVALVTAQVLSANSQQSVQHQWIILFLPLVLASGGNTGSQSATLVIRALAVGTISRAQVRSLARRELVVGAALGSSLAALDFSVAYVWFGLHFLDAGVVASTVFLVVVMGTFVGAMLPLAFKLLGMDPALMSNPLIAALSDFLGVLIYYQVASVAFRTPHG